MNDSEIFDSIIIGAGPAGMTAAIFARTKNLHVLIMEGGKAGGQLINLYPYKPVYNYPGYAQITAGKLARQMIRQVQRFDIPIVENSPVLDIRKSENGDFEISGKHSLVKTKTIILASGLGLSEPRKLNVPGEDELKGCGIEYTIDDIASWAGKEIAVIGGGNSAIDNALLLQEKNAGVTLIHRSHKLRAEAANVEKLQQNDAQMLLGWQTVRFQKENDSKISMKMENSVNKQSMCLTFDKILINAGLKPNTELLEKTGLEKAGKQIQVDTEMQTSVPGIFSCGDAVFYPGKVRLIVTAIGEAATAVNSMQKYLNLKYSHLGK